MDAILKDLQPTRLTTAIEENLISWIPLMGKIWESRENDPPGVKRSISNIPVSLFNSIMDSRLAEGEVEPTILYLLSDAEIRKVPILWWTGPSTRPVDLAGRLLQHGFSVDEDGSGMAVILEELNESLPVPDHFSIHSVQDEASQWEWCQTMAAGFGIPAERSEFAVTSWFQLISKLDQNSTIAYTGFLEDKPVATSLLQLGGGVAGIYAVATIPEARRRGIGAQVTLYPLLEARLRGYKAGVLEASEMGFPVYRSLGFQEYCRICSYVWRPKEENK